MGEPDDYPWVPADRDAAISVLKSEVHILRDALDWIAQVVAEDAALSGATRREVDRIVLLARRGEAP